MVTVIISVIICSTINFVSLWVPEDVVFLRGFYQNVVFTTKSSHNKEVFSEVTFLASLSNHDVDSAAT